MTELGEHGNNVAENEQAEDLDDFRFRDEGEELQRLGCAMRVSERYDASQAISGGKPERWHG